MCADWNLSQSYLFFLIDMDYLLDLLKSKISFSNLSCRKVTFLSYCFYQLFLANKTNNMLSLVKSLFDITFVFLPRTRFCYLVKASIQWHTFIIYNFISPVLRSSQHVFLLFSVLDTFSSFYIHWMKFTWRKGLGELEEVLKRLKWIRETEALC